MKTTTVLFLLFLLVIGGCKKDEDDNKPANYFSLDESVYALTKGYLAAGKIYLMSDGMTIKGLEQNTGNPIYQGTGDLFTITSISGQNSIVSGSYDLTKINGEVYTNFNPALTTQDYQQVLNTGTGSCAITLNGLQCTIEVNGTLQDAKAIVVKFNGQLDEPGK